MARNAEISAEDEVGSGNARNSKADGDECNEIRLLLLFIRPVPLIDVQHSGLWPGEAL